MILPLSVILVVGIIMKYKITIHLSALKLEYILENRMRLCSWMSVLQSTTDSWISSFDLKELEHSMIRISQIQYLEWTPVLDNVVDSIKL